MTALLERNQLTPALLLRNFLDSLQPRDTDNGIRLGYMIGINVYDLFRPGTSGDWVFDDERVRFFAGLFREVGRPVVVNLRVNHFFGAGLLAAELMSDESSFARTSDGCKIQEIYYRNPFFAPTFALDEGIRLNQFRFGGLRLLAAALAEFERQSPDIIQAYTVGGEIHQFLPELADSAAAGRFQDVQMTDYSESSIREFRCWLRDRYANVAEVNERFGTPFSDWSEVEPPRRDLRPDFVSPTWQHMDSYADGYLPVFGWAELAEQQSIRIYVDGAEAGEAEYGLGRLDVYEALEGLTESDIGFRFELDYRRLRPGAHVIHAVIRRPGETAQLIGRRSIVVGVGTSASGAVNPVTGLDDLPDAHGSAGAHACLDHPPEGLTLLFNPWAAEWHEFRQYQVQALLRKLAEIAIESGLPRDKLYSHQMMPQLEGTWNRVAFAVQGEPAQADCYAAGIDLYGGATVYRGLERYPFGRKYAVPEFHPRMGRLASKDIFRRGLEYHRRLGARFLCPYFMALREPHGAAANPVDALLIHPLNPAYGSMFFYAALVEFLNQRPPGRSIG